MAWIRCTGGNGGSPTPTPVEPPKFTGAVGTTGFTIVDGRYIYGFNSSAPAYIPKTPSNASPVYDMTKKMRLHLRFMFTSATSSVSAQGLCGSFQSNDWGGMPEVYVRFSSSGVSGQSLAWKEQSGSTSYLGVGFGANVPFALNTWFDYDVSWENGTVTIILTDGTHTNTSTVQKDHLSTTMNNKTFGIGSAARSSEYADKTRFDLANCYWEQDGVLIWGNKEAV